MITHQTTKKTVLVGEKLVGVSKPICSVTKTVDHHVCDNCGHTYEREGLSGFFEQMFEGCPSCGHSKEEEYA